MTSFLFTLQTVAAFNFILIGIIILLNKARVTYGVKILAFFLLAKGTTLSTNLYYYQNSNFPQEIVQLLSSTLFFYAPLLFFFARYVTKKQVFKFEKDSLHFIPFGLYLGLNIVLIITPFQSSLLDYIITYSYYLQTISYTLVSFSLLHKNDDASEMQKWLKNLLFCFLIIWLLFLSEQLAYTFGTRDVALILKTLGVLSLLVLANLTIVIAIFSPDLFYKGLRIINQTSNYQNYITENNFNQIVLLMTEKELHANPSFKLEDLANEIGFSERNTSLIIKEYHQGNFADFLNSFRIEQAKQLFIEKQDELTISEVLYEVGFNSKSTFNTLFKKKVGMTPSEFKKINCLTHNAG